MNLKQLFTALAATALIACAGQQVSVAPSTGTVTLSVVGTNDLHGRIASGDDSGGLPLLGGYVANLRAARARDGGAVLLVDAGDMFQGTLESNLNEGAVVVAAYNELGYAAAAVGNHEFDFGPVGPSATPQGPDDDPHGALKARAAEARFPFLAANLIDASTNRPVAWPNVRPSTMITAAGVEVGIVGVMTARALSGTIAANVRGLRVAPLAETIAAEAARLRDAGASVIVVAAHAGGRCTEFSDPTDLSSCDLGEEIVQVARALPPRLVDVIVAGHRHAAMAHQIAGVAVTQSEMGGQTLGRVDVIVDRASRRVVERRSFPPRDLCARVDPGTITCDPPTASGARVQAEYEGAPVVPSAAVAGIIAPAERTARAQKDMPLGVTLVAPLRRGREESALGNLFADAYRAAIQGADVSFNNTSGGIRADLPAGPLTYGAVYEAMPFDNRLVAFHLTGAELRTVLATQLLRSAAFVGISGVRVRAECRGTALEVAVLRPNGAPIGDSERLLVATSDFLAMGGDGIFEPVTPPDGFDIQLDAGLARDAVVRDLEARGGVLRDDQLVDPVNPRWVIPHGPPVKCGQ